MSNLRSGISAPPTYLEKISHQPIISHLENGSLWILVDGNNSLDKKKDVFPYKLGLFKPTLSAHEYQCKSDQVLKG